MTRSIPAPLLVAIAAGTAAAALLAAHLVPVAPLELPSLRGQAPAAGAVMVVALAPVLM